MEINILAIEENDDDKFFFKRAVVNSGLRAQVQIIPDGLEGLQTLRENNFDCIFLDYHLPGMNGLDILKNVRQAGIETPIIMLTGQKDEQTIVNLLRAGANDYLPKRSLNAESLRICIDNALKLHKVEKEKLLAEKALKVSEARLAEAQKIAHIGNWEYDIINKVFFFSEEANHILGNDPRNSTTLTFLNFSKKINPEDFVELKKAMAKPVYDINVRYQTDKYTLSYLNIKGHLVKELHSKKVIGTIQDITELKTALSETQKAVIKSRATTIVLCIAVFIFLVSEALIDPVIDGLTTSLLISLSFKGGIALALKPLELFLEKVMATFATVS